MEISQLLSTPIPQRLSPSFFSTTTLHKFTALIFFLTFITIIHSFQFLTLLFLIIPIKYLKEIQIKLIRFSKESFSSLLICLVVLFGKSKFVISSNNLSNLESFLVRDEEGKVVGFKFDDMSG